MILTSLIHTVLGLPQSVCYTNICDFLICSSSGSSCDPANAFKSLDGFWMVYAEGWMSTLQTKV